MEAMEKAWKNSDYRNILNKASVPFRGMFDDFEIESYQMEMLWVALNKYDPSKSKFTTYLFDRMRYKLLDEAKKLRRRITLKTNKNFYSTPTNNSVGYTDLVESLGENKELLLDRYLGNKTIKELSSEYKISPNKIKKILSKAKDKVLKMSIK